MKCLWNLFFAFVLILPGISRADELTLDRDPDDVEIPMKEPNFFMFPEGFTPSLWGIAIGGGPGMFSTGADVIFGKSSVLYETVRPDSVHGMWGPPHVLMWMNRVRIIYDYDKFQSGIFFQPNLRYLLSQFLLMVAVGPEIGWESKTGFEYGASIRVGGLPSLWMANYEVGYLVNSQRFYFTISFCISQMFAVAMSV